VTAEPAGDDGEPAVGSCMVVPSGYTDGESVPDQADASVPVELHGSGRGGNIPEEMVLLGDAQPPGTGPQSSDDDQAPLGMASFSSSTAESRRGSSRG
jgi:hypothetical protein